MFRLTYALAAVASLLLVGGAVSAAAATRPDDRANHGPGAVSAVSSDDVVRPDDRAWRGAGPEPASEMAESPTVLVDGFDWVDAGIGASASLGLLLFAGGAVLLLRRGRVKAIVAAVIVTGIAAGAAFGSSSSTTAGENPVVHWSGVAEAAISAPTPPATALRPPSSSAVLAGMVHAAMYDAVVAIEGGFEPFATAISAAPGASVDAAVAQAARDVLVARVPAQSGAVQSAYDAFMTAIPAGTAKESGKAVGAAAAAGMLASRAGDGFDDAVPYVQTTPGPGVFEPVAPTTPVDVKLGKVRPFTYAGAAYRPDPPFALTSKQYADDVAEVQNLGRGPGSPLTPAQTELVRFYAEPTYRQYSRGLRALAGTRGLDTRQSARLLGYSWVAIADTMIACFEAKYHYMFWRPSHAIQRADTDGNPATTPDPAWTSLLTVNHPEYPSGHGCYTAGLTKAVQEFFGTKWLDLTFTATINGATVTKSYTHIGQLVSAVEDARVWAGIHYRTTMTESAKHFPRIAKDIYNHHFRAVRSAKG